MNIQLNDLSETRKSLVVTLDQSEVAAEHQAVVAQFAREARLPGFRPGKAPAAMVAKSRSGWSPAAKPPIAPVAAWVEPLTC